MISRPVILSGRDHKLIATVVRMSRRHVRLAPWAAEPCGPRPMFLVQHAQYELLSAGAKPAMDLPTTYPIAPHDRNGNGHPLRSMNLYKQVVLRVSPQEQITQAERVSGRARYVFSFGCKRWLSAAIASRIELRGYRCVGCEYSRFTDIRRTEWGNVRQSQKNTTRWVKKNVCLD